MVEPSIPVVILCGGVGSRLAEQTDIRPKPLVEIGGHPILWHIMKQYGHFGFNDFVLALGYRGDQIKRYFLDYQLLSSDLCVTLESGAVTRLGRNGAEPWRVRLVDTGDATQTGGRLRRLAAMLGGGTFMMTYGDGVSDIDVCRLLQFHRRHGKLATITAVRPPARFGNLAFQGDLVTRFEEKPQIGEGWISGGFFVLEPGVLDYIDGDMTLWEREPLEGLARDVQLAAFRHDGFWQCMDTMRDLKLLEGLWQRGHAPWRVWG